MPAFSSHLSLLFPQADVPTLDDTSPLKPGSHSSLFCLIN